MNERMLEELFGGQYRLRALRSLYEDPGRSFTVRELAEAAQTDASNLRRLLRRWAAAGIVEATDGGKFAASPDPSLQPVALLFQQQSKFVSRMRDLFAQMPEIDAALIFGSVARGAERAASDIDILAIGKASEIKVNARLKPLSREIGRPIHVTVLEEAEFRQQIADGEAYLIDLLGKPTIPLKGHIDAATIVPAATFRT